VINLKNKINPRECIETRKILMAEYKKYQNTEDYKEGGGD